jgi:phage-related minor tail protein
MTTGEKRDMDATAAAAEKLSPALESAAASVEAELRALPTPMLAQWQWKAFDRMASGGRASSGRTAEALERAGLIERRPASYGPFRLSRFGDELARRRRGGQ